MKYFTRLARQDTLRPACPTAVRSCLPSRYPRTVIRLTLLPVHPPRFKSRKGTRLCPINVIPRRLRYPQRTPGKSGRIASESVGGINRNGWPDCLGISGPNQSEWVGGIRRNTHTNVGVYLICPKHGQQTGRGSSKSLRIFLSYGHDGNEVLVSRIKNDLINRGHDVWFDKTEIRFGDDWRRAITDGITESNRVLSFLSRHSTREPVSALTRSQSLSA